VQIGFVAICLAAVASLLALSKPMIDNTIMAFPDGEAGSTFKRDMNNDLGMN
jgi:hypothetical protein